LSLQLGYQAVTLLGSAHADELPTAAPPALAGLTPGVDYGPIPVEDYDAYTTPYAQYESGSTIFAGWADWPITVESSCFWGFTSGNTDTYPSPSALPVNFWYRDPLSVTPNAVAQPGDWLTYQELGTSLLDHDLLLNLVFVNSYNTDYNDVTIPLSAMDLADASVIMQARYQHGVVIPTVDLTSGGVSQFGFNGLFADPDLGSFSLKPPFATTTTFAPAPQVKFTTPRWRYWIPEGNLSVKTDAGWESVFGPDPFAIREAEGTWFSRGGGLNPLRVRGFGAWIDTINVG
jgi:hypothetical protein